MTTVDIVIEGMLFKVSFPKNMLGCRRRSVLQEVMESVFKRDDLKDFHEKYDESCPYWHRTMNGDAKIVGGIYGD